MAPKVEHWLYTHVYVNAMYMDTTPLTSFLLLSNFVSLCQLSLPPLSLFLPNSSSSRASVFTTLQTYMLLRALSLFTLPPCVHVRHLAWLVLPSWGSSCLIIGGHVPVCVRHPLWSF